MNFDLDWHSYCSYILKNVKLLFSLSSIGSSNAGTHFSFVGLMVNGYQVAVFSLCLRIVHILSVTQCANLCFLHWGGTEGLKCCSTSCTSSQLLEELYLQNCQQPSQILYIIVSYVIIFSFLTLLPQNKTSQRSSHHPKNCKCNIIWRLPKMTALVRQILVEESWVTLEELQRSMALVGESADSRTSRSHYTPISYQKTAHKDLNVICNL